MYIVQFQHIFKRFRPSQNPEAYGFVTKLSVEERLMKNISNQRSAVFGNQGEP